MRDPVKTSQQDSTTKYPHVIRGGKRSRAEYYSAIFREFQDRNLKAAYGWEAIGFRIVRNR